VKYQKEYGAGYGGSCDKNNVYFGDDASAGDAFDPTLNLFQWDAYSLIR
jgi:hypothetical protein